MFILTPGVHGTFTSLRHCHLWYFVSPLAAVLNGSSMPMSNNTVFEASRVQSQRGPDPNVIGSFPIFRPCSVMALPYSAWFTRDTFG